MNGQLICITGIDGAGKSTQAKRLVARLQQEGYRARYVWGGRRAVLTAPLVHTGKRMFRAPNRPTQGTPHANHAYRSYVSSARHTLGKPALRAAWHLLATSEHVAQLLANVELPLLRGEIVVCDRYGYDTLVSQMALLEQGAWQLLDALQTPLMRVLPRPALGFWLDVPPHVATRRKTDIYDMEQLNARAPLYAALAANLGFVQLDATRDADALAATIWNATETVLIARNTPHRTFSIQH